MTLYASFHDHDALAVGFLSKLFFVADFFSRKKQTKQTIILEPALE